MGNRRLARWVWSLLAVAIPAAVLLVVWRTAVSQPEPSIAPAVRIAAAASPVRVLISLAAPAAELAAVQDGVLAQLDKADFQLRHSYRRIPALAGTITEAGLAQLAADRRVTAVHLDLPGAGHLAQSVPGLGADVVHATYGYTGQGVTVAVLDTGVDTDHPDLSDDIAGQYCFTAGDCPPDRTNQGSSAEDEHGHGTNVTGIITGKGVVAAPGFAPDADIVAVRVLASDNTGWVSDWVAGLDWVLVNRATYNIRLVNMSLGTFALYSGVCDAQQPQLASAVAQLNAAGVTVFASSGNQGSATSLAAPACNSGVVAVGATYDSEMGREPDSGTYRDRFGGSWPACFDDPTNLLTITCFTNSNGLLAMVAPGARLTAAGLGGGVSTFTGTSQGSPTAAAIAALLLEAEPGLDRLELRQLLQGSGPLVTDPKNGLAFPAINALNAVAALPAPPTAITITGPITGEVNSQYVFTATTGPLTVTLPISYVWEATGQPPVTQVGGVSATAAWQFAATGPHTITVTAANVAGQVSAAHVISLSARALAGVMLNGPATGFDRVPLPFTAVVSPTAVLLPISYTWQATEQLSLTVSGGVSNTVIYTWPLTGTKTITVTAAAGGVSASASQLIAINRGYRVALPVVLRR